MKCRSLLLAAGLTGALLVGATGTAQAADKVPSGCTGARQLGATAYVTDSAGAKIASVKQYYGVCGGTPKNWSYVYVWQSFYDSGKSYNVKAAILVGSSTEGAGFRSAARPTRELNSTPVATTGSCTRAFGGYDLASSTRTAQTAQDC